jgi:hypothetical protein
MLEIGSTCKLKGEKKRSYIVKGYLYEDDGETLKGYRLYSNFNGGMRYMLPEQIRPQKKKRGRKRPPTS